MSDDERRIKELASDIVNHAFLQPKGDFQASLNAVEELLRLSWRKPRPVIPQGRGDVKTIVGFDRASPDGDFTGLTLLFSDGSIKHYHEAQPEGSVEAKKNIPELYARREVGAGDGDTYVGECHTREYRLYYELIYAVGNVWPGETRHQTALRYIREAERGSSQAGLEEKKP